MEKGKIFESINQCNIEHGLHQFYQTSCVVYQDGSQLHLHRAKKIKF